jgi:hypothetical protein
VATWIEINKTNMSRRKNRQTDNIDDTEVQRKNNNMQERKSTWCNITFDKFIEEGESWDSFIGRLENYFAMMGIENNDTKKSQVLIHTMRVNTYQQLCDHLCPEKPTSKDYEELVEIVGKILNPRPSIITEQYNFTLRKQNEGETIMQYVCGLKKMAKYCNFKCNLCTATTQEEHIRQQFISGLQDENFLKELLKNHKIMTLCECVDLAGAVERASREAEIIHGKESVSVVKGYILP